VAIPSSLRAQVTDPPTLILAQDDSGDIVGNDHAALQAALDRLAGTGGLLLVRPGVYELHAMVKVPGGVTLRGAPGAVLQLPRPSLFAEDAPRGATFVQVDDASGFRVGSPLELLPPIQEGLKWPDDTPLEHCWCRVQAIEGNTLHLERPLARAMPAGSRIGYRHKLLLLYGVEDVTLENLTIDGGAVDGIRMPGHHQRTAIWATAPMERSTGPTGPPTRNVTVRDCEIRNCYGRAVAFYNTVESRVTGCRIDNVSDEAIDFDHYAERCTAAGNRISRATWGVALNDASRCLVEDNEIADCGVGVTLWWLESVVAEGINEENVIRDNTITGSERFAITVGQACHRNEITCNVVEGQIRVV